MLFRRSISTVLAICLFPALAAAQSEETEPPTLSIELNALQDVGGACRVTFLARNGTDTPIDKAVFEAVIFDSAGGVVRLSLFDFRDLPVGRPRVRQFDVADLECGSIGQALINGANSCEVAGSESDVCDGSLSLGSRIDVELLG